MSEENILATLSLCAELQQECQISSHLSKLTRILATGVAVKFSNPSQPSSSHQWLSAPQKSAKRITPKANFSSPLGLQSSCHSRKSRFRRWLIRSLLATSRGSLQCIVTV